jgi:hypothetical protein
MYTPVSVDKDFVPYTKRPVLKRNAGLFVDGAAGRGGSVPRVFPQSSPPWEGDCSKLGPNAPCYIGSCIQGKYLYRTCDSDYNCGDVHEDSC